jgi:hypothetical protein
MIERARAVAGTLEFLHPEAGGTAVVFTFATMREEDDREATTATRWAIPSTTIQDQEEIAIFQAGLLQFCQQFQPPTKQRVICA